MIALRKSFGTLGRYLRVMQGPGDALRYARLRSRYRHRDSSNGATHAETIHVRALGGLPVLCRASQDVWTFKHTFLHGFHLPPVTLPAAATILDLGSNVGYTVAHLAYRHPQARVIGVEMNEQNVELARHNTAAFGSRVELIHAAVWKTDGVITYTGEADDAFRVADLDAGSSSRSAPARTLDTLLDQLDISWVHYVKMDIEGAEAAVLEGPLAWMDRVGSLKIEIHPPAEFARCRQILESRGFRCWADEQHWNGLCAVRTQ